MLTHSFLFLCIKAMKKIFFAVYNKDSNSCATSRRGRVYHQHEVLNIIKPQENARWRVMRYKGGLPPLMICTARCAAMIYQACGLDKKIRQVETCRFFWQGLEDCDSRRELRALVVRRENSSTGRVFYTAPTSSHPTHAKK